jgi:hypothetical protein
MQLPRTRVWRWLLWIAPAFSAVGIWQCVATGEAINADGVSYLDLARQYSNGDFSAVSNGYWSPAYPLILGVATRLAALIGLGQLAELVVTYAVNVLLLLAALVAFAYLLDALSNDGAEGGSPRRFGDAWSHAAAWAIAAWTLIKLGSISVITPDTLVAALLFGATALLARRARAQLGTRAAIALGVLTAAAYLAKAVMFPIAFVLLIAFAVFSRSRREIGLVAVAFGLIAGPLVVVQSVAAGRLSFGETGRLNYAWFVNRAEATVTDVGAAALRPPRAIVGLATVPGTKLYADSAPGTFPPWYDASRWNPGVVPTFDIDAQLLNLMVTRHWLRTVLGLPALIVLLCIGLALEARRQPWLAGWPLLLAPIATIGIYALVHIEGRLVGASAAVIGVVLLAMSDARGDHVQSRSRELLYTAIVALCLFDTGRQLVRGPRVAESRYASRIDSAAREAGLGPGSDVAVIGSAMNQGAYWAHLAHVQIVATIPPEADSTLTPAVMAALSAEACRAGRDLRAVIGRGEAWRRAASPRVLDDGWYVWLNPVRGKCIP